MKVHDYVLDPTDKWHPLDDDDYPARLGVQTFVRDLHEQRHGQLVHVWRNGAYQVRGRGRTKTFKGETAWSDAARLHHDRLTEARLAR